MKTCFRCKETKTLEHFGSNPSWCKPCRRSIEKNMYVLRKRQPPPPLALTTMRVCRKCRREQPITNYYTSGAQGTGRHSECKSCALAERQVSYRKNPAAMKQRADAWNAANPVRARANKVARKKYRKQAVPPWLTNVQHAQIQEFYEIADALTCQTGVEHQVDHTFPVKGRNFCGLHVPWNLQVLTAEANNAKRCRVPDEFSSLLRGVIHDREPRSAGGAARANSS